MLLAVVLGLHCAPAAAQDIIRLPPADVEESSPEASPDIVRLPPVEREELPRAAEDQTTADPAATWWEKDVSTPLKFAEQSVGITLDAAVLATLQHSPQVKAMSDRALARQLAVGDPAAKFDMTNFVSTRLNANSDPVGSTLTTGGASRFIDTNWSAVAGVRKLQTNGGQWELSQRLGWQDTNSIYFLPTNQGTAKMVLSYTHPIMRGAGCDYQNSVIVLAEIDASVGGAELRRDLQSLLVDVHRHYWDLYLQRAAFLQRRRLHAQAVKILEELLARQGVDTLESQILRARAAVRRREAAMTRHSADARNAEARLLAIINDPAHAADRSRELVPLQGPAASFAAPALQRSLTQALEHRPEIYQALQEIKAATVRVNVARNEIQPAVSLVLGTYLSGLQGDSNIPQSVADQFYVGRPSAFAGVEFENPWGSRAANARYQQRQVELRQMTHELQATTATVRAEVEIAAREIQTAASQLKSRIGAIQAIDREVSYLLSRWRLLPGEGPDAGVVLDDILSEQERLSDAELAYVTAQTDLNLAHVQLLRATGMLLENQQVEPMLTTKEGLPVYSLRRLPTSDDAAARTAVKPRLEGIRR